jgi:hypothetical protein
MARQIDSDDIASRKKTGHAGPPRRVSTKAMHHDQGNSIAGPLNVVDIARTVCKNTRFHSLRYPGIKVILLL